MTDTQYRTETQALLTRAATIITRERGILRMRSDVSHAQKARINAMEQWLTMYAYAYPAAPGEGAAP